MEGWFPLGSCIIYYTQLCYSTYVLSATSKYQRISVLPTRLTSEKTYLDVPSNKSNLNMSPVTIQLPISKNIFHTVFALD